MSFIRQHLNETAQIAYALDESAIERLVTKLETVRAKQGRLFVLGVGGSAANASHAVNDFRKLAGFEAYAPTDNVAELTARTNDDGWESTFMGWLAASRLHARDAVLVLSVGGGQPSVSQNIVRAINYALSVGATILGIIGRDGGYTATMADVCVIVPTVNANAVTPHAEAFQAVIWHLLVSHPRLALATAKWEGLQA